MIDRKLYTRGIIKWHPFAAINDPEGDAYALNVINNMHDHPELCQEQIDEITQSLKVAQQEQLTVGVSYFYEGYFRFVEGAISKIDVIQQVVTCGTMQIEIMRIVDVYEV